MLQVLKTTLGGFLDGFTGAGLVEYLSVPGEPIIGFAPSDTWEGLREEALAFNPAVNYPAGLEAARAKLEVMVVAELNEGISRAAKLREILDRYELELAKAPPPKSELEIDQTEQTNHGG